MSAPEIAVGLLTGGEDKHYAYGLALALLAHPEVSIEFVGSDELDGPEMHGEPRLTFLNLRGNQRTGVSLTTKASRVARYYLRLVRYAWITDAPLFHILWNNKFQILDRTALMLYYTLLGKKIALTAHNVNAGRRDATDTLLNRLSLRMQYRLADRIFVHTAQMKEELVRGFGIDDCAVTIIPYGINNAVPITDLTPAEAKQRLGIAPGDRTILFFGSIARYKGLDYLFAAFERLLDGGTPYRLIVAGRPKKSAESYWAELCRRLPPDVQQRIIAKIDYIADDDAELYFKAADVLALPYRDIFQSGVLFLGYSFGLPVVATDVGALREDIVDGETGFLCRPDDPADFAKTLAAYFESDLFRHLSDRRGRIRDYATERHSWDTVARITRDAYADLLRAR